MKTKYRERLKKSDLKLNYKEILFDDYINGDWVRLTAQRMSSSCNLHLWVMPSSKNIQGVYESYVLQFKELLKIYSDVVSVFKELDFCIYEKEQKELSLKLETILNDFTSKNAPQGYFS